MYIYIYVYMYIDRQCMQGVYMVRYEMGVSLLLQINYVACARTTSASSSSRGELG